LPPTPRISSGASSSDRSKPLSFRLDGRKISGFAGDTVLSAVLAAGLDSYGQFDGATLGLSERFAPLIATSAAIRCRWSAPGHRRSRPHHVGPRPRFAFGRSQSLRHRLDDLADPPWLRTKPDPPSPPICWSSVAASPASPAADAAAAADRSVILVERRPWLGGDARYFGRRRRRRDARSADHPPRRPACRPRQSHSPHTAQRPFALSGDTALLQSGRDRRRRPARPRGRHHRPAHRHRYRRDAAPSGVPGNRQASVVPAIAAYHLAKRYGVVQWPERCRRDAEQLRLSAALRLHDAGITLRRIIEQRVSPRQSRFIDSPRPAASPSARGQLPLGADREHFNLRPHCRGQQQALVSRPAH